MFNGENINYSLRNLAHRKGRSFLTVFSILVGIATIFIFISFGLGLYNYVDSFTSSSSADKLMIMAKGAGMPGMDDNVKLTDDDIKAIEKTGGVYSASGIYYGASQIEKGSESKYTFLISYDPREPLIMEVFQIGIEKGRELKSGDGNVAVLGYNYLLPGKIFNKAVGLNDKITVNDVDLKVVGFFEAVGNPQDDSQIYVTNDEFLKIFPGKDSYAEIVARVDIKNMDRVISDVERNLRKSRDVEEGKEDFYVQSFEDMIESYSGALDVIIGFVILIALISVLVSAVNTANTMITSVLERYKEIGVLKAIGARNSEILGIFLFESSFLGFVAGILGVLLGWGATSLAKMILLSLGWGFLSPLYSVELFLGCVLFATVTGAISGIMPAIKASRINTVDALRYE
ncbi:ABC transporter permease [archaeon]|nr:ABC transporter permease [archaeon]